MVTVIPAQAEIQKGDPGQAKIPETRLAPG
jgi:hypothetical protein